MLNRRYSRPLHIMLAAMLLLINIRVQEDGMLYIEVYLDGSDMWKLDSAGEKAKCSETVVIEIGGHWISRWRLGTNGGVVRSAMY
ncbi:hypothetical protein Tco_0966134 [Tanacetum coccineum]